jgi:hypothetical protein
MVCRQVLIGVLLLLATTVDAIPIDNGVEGDPEVLFATVDSPGL